MTASDHHIDVLLEIAGLPLLAEERAELADHYPERRQRMELLWNIDAARYAAPVTTFEAAGSPERRMGE